MLREAVAQHNSPPTLFELPDGSLGTVIKKGDRWLYQPYNVEALNAHLCQWVTYLTHNGKADTLSPSIDPQLVRSYIGSGQYDGVPQIRRLAPAPVVGDDLSVGWKAGYFAEGKTYITEAMDNPFDVDSSPEGINNLRIMARAAAQRLLHWFDPFAFEDRRSATDCLAMALTPMIASYIPTAVIPGCIFIANREGSGKTTCAQLISVMATGQQAPPITWPSEGQMRPTITTTLKAGSVISLFDNVKTDMDNDGLEALLTSRAWKDRKFHTQDSMELPNDTMWLFTKNSPTISPDLLRRLVLVSLDKFQENSTPWDSSIIHRAIQSRQSIQQDLVTLILAWKYTGARRGNEIMSGFEEWSAVIAGILEEADVSGFLASRAESVSSIYTEDEELTGIVDRIANVMGNGIWTASQLWDKCDISWNEELDYDEGTKKDLRALQAWLRHSNQGRNPAMSTGKKLSVLSGRQMEGSPNVLRKLSGAKARYQVETRNTKDGKVDWNLQLQVTGMV